MSPGPAGSARGLSYADAGVDIEAGERAVTLMAASVAGASRPEVVGSLGGFAGLFDASALLGYRRPLLATSTDGVGTKVAVAAALNRHDTIGIDLVAMVVDDVVVCGAEPLFLTDYIACGRVVPERVAAIVSGIAMGCRQAGCALIGGETAEHPGVLAPDEYDLAGAVTGVVEASSLLGPDLVRAGDAVVAMASTGLHANGYSLVRRVMNTAGLAYDDSYGDGRTLGDVLLTPTRVYAQDCLALAGAVEVHAFAHITGGGLAANLARVVPAGLEVVVDRGTWTPDPVFSFVADRGRVDPLELERTLNMGVGMAAVVAADSTLDALDLLAGRGVPAWIVGEVSARDRPGVRLVGTYAR